ncbi:MAG: hypothetical protein MJZ34_04920 [Paludibacteraceae bacterium]|nr:hypothetical protein [Paludibacteraceae bacterium]
MSDLRDNSVNAMGSVILAGGNTNNINPFNKNKFRVHLSNIPNYTRFKDIDMNVFNHRIKNVSLPEITSTTLRTNYNGTVQIHPNTIGMQELNSFTIGIECDALFMNYYLFYAWAMADRLGYTLDTVITDSLQGEPLIRGNRIETFTLHLMDNEGNDTVDVKFLNCFLTNLSNLDLATNSSEIFTYTCTFEYEQLIIEPIKNNIYGDVNNETKPSSSNQI